MSSPSYIKKFHFSHLVVTFSLRKTQRQENYQIDNFLCIVSRKILCAVGAGCKTGYKADLEELVQAEQEKGVMAYFQVNTEN